MQARGQTTDLLNLDYLPTLGGNFTDSAAVYYTGYVSRNFAIRNDAPKGGNDILLGGTGRDWLDGGVGNNVLNGGGNDYLEGAPLIPLEIF